MLPSDISLGMVIFGRVSSFPWWPAVVSLCPRTELWVKEGKFWVFFFNDNSGAWLKTSEIRAFDSYNRDFCLEYNSSIVKFKRYQDRIQKAVRLAEDHARRTIKKIRIPILRNAPGEDDEDEDDDQEESESSEQSQPVTTANKGRRGKYAATVQKAPKPPEGRRNSTRRRKPSSLPHMPSAQKDTSLQRKCRDEETVDETIDGNNVQTEPRPQRKRVRSSRYENYMAPFGEKNTARRRSSTPSPAADNKCNFEANKSKGSKDGSLPLYPMESFNYWSPPRKTFKKSKSSSSDFGDLSNDFPNGEKHRTGLASNKASKDGTALGGKGTSPSGIPSLDACMSKPRTRRQAREPQGRGAKHQEQQKSSALLTREMYISELTNLVTPKLTARQTRDVSRTTPKVTRHVRSRMETSAGNEENEEVDGTDSEMHPERERRRTAGCLNVAAEDLIEHAIRGGHTGAGSTHRAQVQDMDSVAFGGSDLVSSILNRLSELETDVKHLKKKAAAEENATLGEDVTAAGLKSAVEALATASEAFAKARDYDSGIIGRALEILWADGHFPLTGADGDLLRTVARSLVLATCKRRLHEAHVRKVEPQRKKGSKSPKKRQRCDDSAQLDCSPKSCEEREVVAVEIRPGNGELIDGSREQYRRKVHHGDSSGKPQPCTTTKKTVTPSADESNFETNGNGIEVIEVSLSTHRVSKDCTEEEVVDEGCNRSSDRNGSASLS